MEEEIVDQPRAALEKPPNPEGNTVNHSDLYSMTCLIEHIGGIALRGHTPKYITSVWTVVSL